MLTEAIVAAHARWNSTPAGVRKYARWMLVAALLDLQTLQEGK